MRRACYAVTAAYVIQRIRGGDVLERFESYAAFTSDGLKVRARMLRAMTDAGTLIPAGPTIGAAYTLPDLPKPAISDIERAVQLTALCQQVDRGAAGWYAVRWAGGDYVSAEGATAWAAVQAVTVKADEANRRMGITG